MRASASIAQPGVFEAKALAVSVYAAISRVNVRTATSVIETIFRSRRCLRGVIQCGSNVGPIESCQRTVFSSRVVKYFAIVFCDVVQFQIVGEGSDALRRAWTTRLST